MPETKTKLPENWELKTLGEVCDKPQYGWTTKASQDGELHLLRTTDITSGRINWDTVPYCLEEPDIPEKYLLNHNDIVISRAGSVGYSHIVKNPKVAVFASYLIRFKPNILPDYMAYFLKSPDYWKSISESKAGIAVQNVNATKLQAVSIPLPPFPEQKRIVAKIEELFTRLDAGVENLKKAQIQIKRYRQSVLKDAFEGKLTQGWRSKQTNLPEAHKLFEQIKSERQRYFDRQMTDWQNSVKTWEKEGKIGKKPQKPKKAKALKQGKISNPDIFEIPERWQLTHLQNLCNSISDGPFGSNLKTSDYVDSGIRVIRLENIGNLEFKDDKKSYISLEKYETIERHTVYSGDIIFSSFISDSISVAIIPQSIDFAVNKADCFCVRPTLNETSKYLEYFLSTKKTYNQLVNLVHGATRPRINTTQLKSVLIPMCSILEQKQIVLEIERHFSIADSAERAIEASLKQAERLRQSILKKAFEGKLV